MENVPDREYFVMGSNAGANSSSFDLYRHSKSRELKRLRAMEEEALAEERNAAFKKSMESKNAEEEAKTAARRAKRLKQKVGVMLLREIVPLSSHTCIHIAGKEEESEEQKRGRGGIACGTEKACLCGTRIRLAGVLQCLECVNHMPQFLLVSRK